jgi:hypothetical protein
MIFLSYSCEDLTINLSSSLEGKGYEITYDEEQPICTSTAERINKTQHRQTMEYSSAFKKAFLLYYNMDKP